jgi:hypothetical protein
MFKINKKAMPGRFGARPTISSFSPFEEGFWRLPPAINPIYLEKAGKGQEHTEGDW